jgi:hypothetical protein
VFDHPGRLKIKNLPIDGRRAGTAGIVFSAYYLYIVPKAALSAAGANHAGV